MKAPRPKSLIVALNEATQPSGVDAIRTLPERSKDWTKRMALVGREMDGALELLFYRAYQAGYEACLKHGKRASKAKAMQPRERMA
jgi:hypothetical protein